MATNLSFKEIVEQRHAAKGFNDQVISDALMAELVEMIRLTPTSFNLQPWKVKVVTEQSVKDQLLPASWKQPQVTTCSHLLVFCANMRLNELADKLESQMLADGTPEATVSFFIGMIRQWVSSLDANGQLVWAQKQVYIALSHAMNGAKALGFDSCPMEGFVPVDYSRILELPDDLVPTVVLPLGYTDTPSRTKLRFKTEDMFF